MTYTQGNWSINDWPQKDNDITIGAPGTPLIAKIPLRDVSINEQKANARLIAAAPDLLAALEQLELVEHGTGDQKEVWLIMRNNPQDGLGAGSIRLNGIFAEDMSKRFKIINSAIAKATRSA